MIGECCNSIASCPGFKIGISFQCFHLLTSQIYTSSKEQGCHLTQYHLNDSSVHSWSYLVLEWYLPPPALHSYALWNIKTHCTSCFLHMHNLISILLLSGLPLLSWSSLLSVTWHYQHFFFTIYRLCTTIIQNKHYDRNLTGVSGPSVLQNVPNISFFSFLIVYLQILCITSNPQNLPE